MHDDDDYGDDDDDMFVAWIHGLYPVVTSILKTQAEEVTMDMMESGLKAIKNLALDEDNRLQLGEHHKACEGELLYSFVVKTHLTADFVGWCLIYVQQLETACLFSNLDLLIYPFTGPKTTSALFSFNYKNNSLLRLAVRSD